MRTTFGSPLFAEHVPEHDSLLVERLRAAGALMIGKTNTPEFGAGSQTFNAVFGATRNPYDLTQDAGRLERRRGGRRRGRDAAVRRRLGPRRERPQPGRVLQPRGLRPTPGRIPTLPPGDPWDPFAVHGPIARTAPTRRCCFRRSPAPTRATRCRSRSASPRARPVDPCGLRIAWSRDLGGLPIDPEVTAVLESLRATLDRPRLRRRGRRAGLQRRRRVLRGPARGRLRRRVRGDRRRGQADAGREHAVRALLGADRIARALELRGELFTRMREFLSCYDVSPAPSRRSRRSTSRPSTRPRSRASRWAPTSSGFARAAGSRSPRTRRSRSRPGSRTTACRSGCSSSAATAARLALLRLAQAITEATGLPSARRRSDALAADARRRPRTAPRYRGRRAAPVLARRRRASVARARGVTEADLCIVGGGFTGLWAALYAKALDPARDVVVLEAETAGFGASGRNGGFGVASLTHGIENGLARFAEEMPRSSGSALENFDGLAPISTRTGSTATSSPPATCSRSPTTTRTPWLEEEAGAAARASATRPTVLDAAGDARRGRLPDLPRRGLGQDRRGDPRPGQARRRACATPRCGRRARVRALRRARYRAATVDVAHRRRARAARRRSCSRPAPIRRWSTRSGATSCRSTTTR